jgi:hydrogenase maturation protease
VTSTRATPTVVIGVGNSFRRDDGVGEAVAEHVRDALAPVGEWVQVMARDGEPARLIDAWDGAGLAIVVDAMRSGGRVGAVHRVEVDPLEGPPPAELLESAAQASTHGAGVGEAVALGRALGRLPRRLVVFAVEGEDFGDGPGLSTRVEAAVAEVAALVVAELAP